MKQIRQLWGSMTKTWQEAPWSLVLFSIATALALIFGRIAEEVMEGDADAFDRNVIGWFRDSTNPGHLSGPTWLQEAPVWVASVFSSCCC